MTAILDTVVATTFVFLLFSLVVTSLNELLASLLDRRAVFFKISLEEMLNSKAEGKENGGGPLTVTSLLQHGLITSLSRGPYEEKNARGDGVPSYIPANLFGSAVLSLLKGKTPEELKAGIALIPDGSRLSSSMQAFYDEVDGDVAEFRKRVESWFDDAMSRTSGWYKRNAQRWMFFIALGLAVFANVDAIHIMRELSQNPALRQTLAAQAREYDEPAEAAMPVDSKPSLAEKRANYQKSLDALSATGIPMGWKGHGITEICWEAIQAIPTSLLGWLMTACAASMGAPFWFDTLGRIVNLRSAGKAPEKTE